MGESSLDFELVVWVGAEATDFPARVDAAYKWKIHDELIAAHIEIPFPQRDLHLRSGDWSPKANEDDHKRAAEGA